MPSIMRLVQTGIGCHHGNQMVDCVECMALWAEDDRWELDVDEWSESIRLGEAPLDDPLDWLAYVEREAN